MSKTAEYALDNLCRSMGQAEQAEMQRKMREACSDKDLRDIVADFRTYSPSLPVPKDNTATAVPAGAGRVQTWGWCDPVPLQRRDWAGMSEVERKARDEEWARNAESRKAVEKQSNKDQS
jgi:hypothetical protein